MEGEAHMKTKFKKVPFQRILLFTSLLCGIGLPVPVTLSAKAHQAQIAIIRGVVTKVEVGNDSIGLIVQAGAKTLRFSMGPSTDGLPAEYRDRQMRHPSIVDIGSKVEITYQSVQLLDYRLISRPAHVWIVISANASVQQTDSPPGYFQELKYALYQKGCMTEVLNSSQLRALRPGYWIVASGGFLSPAKADVCRKKAIALGIKDAYLRKLW